MIGDIFMVLKSNNVDTIGLLILLSIKQIGVNFIYR